jgi:hypothetical protein
LPIPDDAPVTMQTLASISIMDRVSLVARASRHRRVGG